MKNSFKNIMLATFILLSIAVNAQIKNAKTETVKIYGNCGMCETKIENERNQNYKPQIFILKHIIFIKIGLQN